MIHTESQQNSESLIMREIFKLSDAGASVLHLRTREPVRAAMILRRSIISSANTEYREWDVINGIRSFSLENYTDNKVAGQGEDFLQALSMPMTHLRQIGSSLLADPEKAHFYVFINPHPFMDNPLVIEYIQQYASILPVTNACIILVTPDIPLDSIPTGTLLIADLNTPSAEELEGVITRIVENGANEFEEGTDITEEELKKISYLGLGLSLYEFETYAAISVIEAGDKNLPALTYEAVASGIAKGKTAVIKQSEILELYPSDDMKNVGGMNRLKDWLNARANCYSEEAKDFGIEAPKGFVLVGVPGAGKSLVAKSAGNALGVPVVRLDFGRVFSKYVGDSESRVRAALTMVENMAPCVLFVDEIDKGLGGIGGGGGDAGTSSRVLGSFLTWLQDNKKPVFTIVTANRVDGLPPELLRRGRFDQIFSVTLPNDLERLEVLKIHLEKRGHELTLDDSDTNRFLAASDRYVPAEIESAVKDALILAFNEGTQLEIRHVVTALNEMVPMSKAFAKQIDAMQEWALNNATPVNYPMGKIVHTDVKGVAVEPTRRVRRSVR